MLRSSIVICDNVVDFTATRFNYHIDRIQDETFAVAKEMARYLATCPIDLEVLGARVRDGKTEPVAVVHDVLDLAKSTATSTAIWTPVALFCEDRQVFAIRACYTATEGASLMSCKKRTLRNRFKTESCQNVKRAKDLAISYICSFVLPVL